MPGTALVAALALLAVPADGWVSLDLGLVGTEARAAKVAPTEAGLQLEVDHRAFLSFPGPGAQWLELTVQSGSDLSLLYGTVRDGQFRAGPPQRGGRIRPGRTTLVVEAMTLDGWSTASHLAIEIWGTGALTILSARAIAPPPTERVEQAFDEANRWAAEPVGHLSINTLEPPLWSRVAGTYLTDLLGAAMLLAAAAVLLALRWRTGRWRPRLAVGLPAVVASGAFALYGLARALPAANLAPEPTVEGRILENMPIRPDLGDLVALARRTLPEEARVGVLVEEADWYQFELLCYHLAPRRCVRYRAGQLRHEGMAGVDVLSTEELDALVLADTDDPLPPGFTPVASVSRHDVVARRAP